MNVKLPKTMMAVILGTAFGITAGCVVVVEDGCSDVDCGGNAFCDAGVCHCIGGYYGDADDFCDPIQTWWVTDECNDGAPISFRLFAQDREWVWPAGSDTYETVGLGLDTYEDIVCLEGELVCFGGQSGDVQWGVGIFGEDDCEDCCFECNANVVDMGLLTCQ